MVPWNGLFLLLRYAAVFFALFSTMRILEKKKWVRLLSVMLLVLAALTFVPLWPSLVAMVAIPSYVLFAAVQLVMSFMIKREEEKK